MASASQRKKKRELKKELQNIEKQIYDLETTYLEDTKEFGNVFTGWDAYLSSEKSKVRKSIAPEDRFFSLSSVTSPASRKLAKAKGEHESKHIKKKQKTAASGSGSSE